MDIHEWNDLVQYLSEVYGVPFGVGENEMILPSNAAELAESWFECPECGEPIYAVDWANDPDLGAYQCPVCYANWKD